MLGHDKAVQAIRCRAPKCKVGVAPSSETRIPATYSSEDIEAARRSFFSVNAAAWYWSVLWWSNPMIFGKYPEKGLNAMAQNLPRIGTNDMRTICQPLDFYAQNIYSGRTVKDDGQCGWIILKRPMGYSRTACGWSVTPEALYWGPKFLYERYKLPFYITENGISCHDAVSVDEKVHDPNRQDMLYRYIQQFGKAIADGVDARGYFIWTLMDDFEWRTGYNDRFGIVFVDSTTQKRIPKDSAYWYKQVIETNGGCIQ